MTTPAVPQKRDLEGVNILVADDEEALLRLMARSLNGAGANVVTFQNAEDAIAALKDVTGRRLDVVISDLDMQRSGDGFRILDAAKGIAAPPKVRMLYTSTPIEEGKRAQLETENVILAEKPSRAAHIIALIRARLEQVNSPDSEETLE